MASSSNGNVKIWDDRDARRKYVLEMLDHADDTRIKVIRKNNEALPPALVAYNNKRKKQEAAINVQEATIVPEQPVAINYAGRPVQVEQLTDEELELGIKEYTLSLQLLQQEKEKRDALKAKKAELLKVFSDMAKDEGFSLEDLMGLV